MKSVFAVNWFQIKVKSPKIALALLIAILTCLGTFPKHLTNFPVSVAVAQTSDELLKTADQLERQGIQELQKGNVQGTIQLWQQALAIYEQLQNYPQAGRLLENFGKLFLQLEAYPQAIEVLQKSLEIAKTLQNKSAIESVLFSLAAVYREQKQYTQAAPLYQQALALARELNDIEGQVTALGNLGSIYAEQQNHTLAIALFTEAWKLGQKLQNPVIEMVALKDMATSYYFLGNCDYAQAFYEWGIDIATKINDREELQGLLQNHGNAAYCQGKFDIALKSYEQSLAIAKELNDAESQGELIGNIGLVNVHLGNYAQAIDYLQQDLAIARQSGKRLIEGQALGSLGDAYYFQANYPKALDYYQQSLAVAQETNYTRGVGLMLTNIGATLLKLQQFPDAEKNLRNGVDVLFSLRKQVGSKDENQVAIFERELRTYKLLQQALIAQNKTEEALEASEAGRTRAFVELLANKSSANITVNPPKIQDIKKIANELNATVVEYSVIYEKDETKSQENKLYMWVVQPNGKVDFQQVDLASANISLQALVDRSRELIGVRGRGGLGVVASAGGSRVDNPSDNLQKLYKVLIEPITNLLPNDPNAHVIFVPQEELFLVPFAALQDSNNAYLIDKHTILTAPSLQVLQLTYQQNPSKTASKGALVVGNPSMPAVKSAPGQQPEQLASLPGAEQEAKAIAQLLNTQAITGSTATKANIIPKMQQSSIIHLATHGLLDVAADGTLNTRYAGYQDGGAIALAPQGNDSGLLTVDEILDLKLAAELVVLSACDTARGKITGDGVIGLSRSLMSAGASSVLVSLWSVPDAPTAQLMSEFYRQFQQNPDKARALRQAMLTTKQQHPNPKDWAAFTLMGKAN